MVANTKKTCRKMTQPTAEPVKKKPASAKAMAAMKKKEKTNTPMRRHTCKADLSDMETYVLKVMAALVKNGRKEVVDRIKSVCKAFKDAGGLYKASGCTGSNVALPSSLAFFKALRISVPVYDLFSAEGVGFKQDWIKMMCKECGIGEHCVFDNVEHLRHDEAHCIVHGGHCPVPSVSSPMSQRPFIYEEGFSCKLFSNLFNGRDDLNGWSREELLAALLEDRVGSTGVTFGAMLDFGWRCRPEFILWENVEEALKPEQIDIIIKCFAKIDFACAAGLRNSHDYDNVENRSRAWGVAQNSLSMGKTWASTLDNVNKIMNSVKQMETGGATLETRLLPASHKYISALRVHMAETAEGREENDIDGWHQKHRQYAWSHAGIRASQLNDFSSQHRANPFFSSLPLRDQQIIRVKSHMNPRACCIELSHNIDRSATMSGRLSCLLPSGKQWVRLSRKNPDWATSKDPKPTEERILTGAETCMIQGIPKCIVDKAVEMGFSNHKLQDLGANAFDGRVYVAHLAAIFSVIDPDYVREFYETEGLGRAVYEDIQDADGATMAASPSARVRSLARQASDATLRVV